MYQWHTMMGHLLLIPSKLLPLTPNLRRGPCEIHEHHVNLTPRQCVESRDRTRRTSDSVDDPLPANSTVSLIDGLYLVDHVILILC